METVDEAIKERPRLCRVTAGLSNRTELQIITRVHAYGFGAWKQYIGIDGRGWDHAALVKRSDIEPFLGVE